MHQKMTIILVLKHNTVLACVQMSGYIQLDTTRILAAMSFVRLLHLKQGWIRTGTARNTVPGKFFTIGTAFRLRFCRFATAYKA